jgi:hypothetical protein
MMDSSWRIQANSGTVDPAATSFTATLPAPTSDGSTLMLFFAYNGSVAQLPAADPPWVQDQAAAGVWGIWRRPGQPAGETSWTVTAVTSTRWAWRAEEWAALSTVSQPDAASAVNNVINQQANPTNAASPDITDFAALAMWRAAGGISAGVFPAGRNYDAGWSEVDVVTVGDGLSNTDFQLILAESYPGASGALTATMTWDITGGGTYTDKSTACLITCLQPAVPAPSSGVLAA